MERLKRESRIFYENGMWQRFIHWMYCNNYVDDEITFCEEIIQKALRYAILSKTGTKIDVNASIINPLQKTDYLEVYKSNIERLKSLQEQNGQAIEAALVEFDAPAIQNRLMLWKPVFEEWKKIYSNPENEYYNLVYENIQIILKQEGKVSREALHLGLQNSGKPKGAICKTLCHTLQCKHSANVKILLKKIILEENTPRYPYERGNAKFFFCTDKAIRQYSDTWDIIPHLSNILSSTVQKSCLKKVEKMQTFSEQTNKVIADDLQGQSESIGEYDNCITSITNLSLRHTKKRGLEDFSPEHDEKEKKERKRRKLFCSNSNESLCSIITETNTYQQEDSFDENMDQSDINNNYEVTLLYSELQTAKTIINSLSGERKNILVQIKELHEDLQNLQNQKNLCNQHTALMRLELEKKRKVINELQSDKEDTLKQISKLREDLENQQILEELRLKSDLKEANKIISELKNDREEQFTKIDVLQAELQETRETIEKIHQESKNSSKMCCSIT